VKVIIAGGGTAGHLFPAIALAEELRSRLSTLSLLFVGASEGLEASLLAKKGWAFEGIRAAGLLAKPLPERIRSLALVPSGFVRSWSILRRFSPHVVVGLGGYASAAMLLAAAARRVPTVIHEQNGFPGLTNRWLSRLVDLVAVSFETASPFFPPGKVRVTGNPVRVELLGVGRADAIAKLGLDPDRLTLLVFGGSQGAHRVNVAVMEGLPLLVGERDQVQFLHATGSRDVEAVRRAYLATGHRAVVEPFFWEMAAAYAAADLCLCRAGASTVAELCALGKPSVLVPFPFAANDHQRWNAEALVARGAAHMLPDRDLNGPSLSRIVKGALQDREGLREMGSRARALANLDASARLADLVIERAHGGQFAVHGSPSTADRQPSIINRSR
jgi:UDP-N-acetylglucosamine--N-acetylmuramyl-(pentapeptide) pyrophosphoryl-undecaprenol N-acetylglucosamine transferase